MAATPSQSANLSNSATWRFHDRLRFITHDPHQCDVCDQWIAHFMRDIILRDDTLAEAETQRDAAFLGQLHATRAEMSALRHDLDDLRRQHRRTLDQLDRLRSKLSEAHKTITKLRDDEAAQNAHGDDPRRRKVARQQGTPTSPSPSRLSSCPDSLLLEDHVDVMNPGQNQNAAPSGLDGGASRKGQPAAAKVTLRSRPETMRASKSGVDARKG